MHLTPPFAGQGISAGLGDAHNLAWKIATALNGPPTSALLDSYRAERRPHVTRLLALSVLLGLAIQTRRPRLALTRDVALRGLLAAPGVHAWATAGGWKPPSGYSRGFVDARSRSRVTGTQLPQPEVWLRSGEQRRLDDVLGPRFALIGFDTDPSAALDARTRTLLSALSVRLVRIVSEGSVAKASAGVTTVEDRSGRLCEWFSQAGAVLVLVRPDRHVYAALSPDRACEVVTDLALALGSERPPARRRPAHFWANDQPGSDAACGGARRQQPTAPPVPSNTAPTPPARALERITHRPTARPA